MRYYKDTDSLYIDLSEKPSKESLEVAPGIVADFDENNNGSPPNERVNITTLCTPL